ncbi:hypothetical protein [Enterococcus faecalis]|uniref:hypothetical protein n=1 Tax=Enterococcus faecalis TaxID=1351 RepID=UPI001F56B81C|nr:hypothetical protein [Enterococcus faecalis]
MKENIQESLRIIEQLKRQFIQNIKISEQNFMEIMADFLRIEAEIVNIISIAIYFDFNEKKTIETY